MINEDYVSFEIARQLKEKGFNEQCFTYYDNTNDSINRFDKGYHFNNTSYPWGVPYNINNAKKYVCAPTLQMAMKWLREAHNIFIQITVDFSDGAYPMYDVCVIDLAKCTSIVINGYNRYSYEEAIKAGIKYCLENLI